MTLLFHSLLCSATECDPGEPVDTPSLLDPPTVNACPISDPTVVGPVEADTHQQEASQQ